MILFALIFFVTQAGGVTLQWDPNSEPDLSGYNVYRSDGGDLVKLNPELVTEPTFTDESPDMRTTYRYYVTAVSPGGESDPSDEVEVNILQFKLDAIAADIEALQQKSRDARDHSDAIRSAIEDLEDRLGNDPEMITRRFVAGNAVRQYEILLSHLNALVRLLSEVK